jgi:hypothetical protein
VRIRQKVKFVAGSTLTSASEITAQLGIEPDRFAVRCSRSVDPPRPVTHRWEVHCDVRGLRVDEQISRVIARLLPHQDKVAALGSRLRSEDPPGSLELSIVRYFDDDEGEEDDEREVTTPSGQVLQRLPGQHQLLGWGIDSDVLGFLQSVGAWVDVDEYG